MITGEGSRWGQQSSGARQDECGGQTYLWPPAGCGDLRVRNGWTGRSETWTTSACALVVLACVIREEVMGVFDNNPADPLAERHGVHLPVGPEQQGFRAGVVA